MQWLDTSAFLGLCSSLIGAIGVLWRSPTWGRSGGLPPLDYTLKTQHQLLASFSDAIGPRGITPRAMRDFVASTITTVPGGDSPSIPLPLPGWTSATRPTGMIGPAIGYNYDLRAIDMWDDRLGQWINPAFGGGTIGAPTRFAGPVAFDGPILANLPNGCFSDCDCGGRCRGCDRASRNQLWNNGQTVSICP